MLEKVNMFETCARKAPCKYECPSCNNDMCLGTNTDGKPCVCYSTIKIINDASIK